MKNIEESKISFIGGGNIAGIFIERLINSGFIFSNNILVSDIKQEKLDSLKEKYSIQTTQNNEEAAKYGDFVFIAVPPPQIKAVLSENCKMINSDQVLISLAAEIPLWIFESVLCKDIATVRVIPNTPSLIGKGVNPYCFGKHLTAKQIKDTEELLSVFGSAIKITESQMNIASAITAICPAYLFPAIKALKDFATSNLMNEEVAITLITQTFSGLTDLINESGPRTELMEKAFRKSPLEEKRVKEVFAKEIVETFLKITQESEILTQ